MCLAIDRSSTNYSAIKSYAAGYSIAHQLRRVLLPSLLLPSLLPSVLLLSLLPSVLLLSVLLPSLLLQSILLLTILFYFTYYILPRLANYLYYYYCYYF